MRQKIELALSEDVHRGLLGRWKVGNESTVSQTADRIIHLGLAVDAFSPEDPSCYRLATDLRAGAAALEQRGDPAHEVAVARLLSLASILETAFSAEAPK